MPFTTRIDQDLAIVATTLPRLDVSNAAELRAALLSAFDTGAGRVVLDLSDVDFLDSSALGALIAAAKRALPRGLFAVAGIRPAVARLFELTNMSLVFPIHPDLGDALSRPSA
jgi:anti-sigma B factor antagonist